MISSPSNSVESERMPKKSARFSRGPALFEYRLFARLLVILVLHCSPVLAQFQDYGHPLEEGQAAYISILNLEDRIETPLTEGRRPAWSPDGTRIAFYRPATHSSLGDMFLINADGSGLSWLGAGIEPDWSPDGEHLVFINDKGIAIREVGNSQSVTILEHRFKAVIPYSQGGIGGLYAEYDWGVGRPAWSPDGAVIAFEDLNAPDLWEPAVWLINADGSGLTLLTQTLGYPESGPAWSPDGSRIAMFSWPRGLAIYDFANDNREGILEWDSALGGLHVGAKPTWSPNGDRLALHGISRFGPEVWLIESDGTSPQVLVTNAYEPDWAPSAAQIAFVSNLGQITTAGGFPTAAGEGTVYYRQDLHASPANARSRMVLFQDGRFELQFLLTTGELVSYPGLHVRNGAFVQFDFDRDDSWQATGVFDQDDRMLQLNFNSAMSLSDFENGVYGLTGDVPKGPVKEPDEPKDPPPKVPKNLLPKMPPCNADCGIRGKPVPLQNPVRQ